MTRAILSTAAISLAIAFSVVTVPHDVFAQELMKGHPPAETAPRVDRASQLKAAKAKVEKLNQQLNQANEPFFEEFRLLNDELAIAFQPFQVRVTALKSERADQLEAVDAEHRNLSERRSAALRPLDAQMDAIYKRRADATEEVNIVWRQAQINLRELRNQGVAADDPALLSLTHRVEEIDAQYAEKAKPFDLELDALEAQIDATQASFRPERKALQTKWRQIKETFDQRIHAVYDEQDQDASVKALRVKGEDIRARMAIALGSLPDDVANAENELFFLETARGFK